MKRFLSSFLLVLMAASVANAQNKKKSEDVNVCNPGHYLVFDVGGGLHTLAYNVDGFGSKIPGAGIMVRGGYRYFFTENWGVGTELNFKSFQTTFKADFRQEIENAVDEDGETYTHYTTFDGFKEKQKQAVLSLPVAVYFQQRINKKWKVGGGLGAIFQFELTNKYKPNGGYFKTSGYYERFNVIIYDLPQHNFKDFTGNSGSSKKRSSVGALLEGNALYYITPRLSIDLGIYLTVAMGYKSVGEDTYLFDPDCMRGAEGYKNVSYNGALDSKVVDRATPIALGGMAGIRYQIGKVKERKKPEDKPVDKPVDVPDTNVVVDVPKKDSIPDVVVVNVPETPSVDTSTNGVPFVVDVPKVDTTNAPVVVDNPTTDPKKRDDVEDIDYTKYTRVNVTFGFNESYIQTRPDLKQMLEDIAKIMKQHPNTKLHVTGHTCNIGSLEKNMVLGQKRAEAFKAELVKRGVSGDRITCDSKSYLEPLYPNTNEENRKKNRRVEFTLSE